MTWQRPVTFFTVNHGNLYAVATQDLGRELSFALDGKPDKNMKITLLGSENADLKWKYADGLLTIDLSRLSMADIKSKYAYVFRLEGYFR